MSAAIKLEIVSTETIKPLSSTPKDRRTFNLSSLDQTVQNVYTPILLFYQVSDDHFLKLRTPSSISKHLKDSLSKVLDQFYPLAGRLNNNLFINCNDEGATFLETRVLNHNLSEFLAVPDYQEMETLVQSKATGHEINEGRHGLPDAAPLLIVQANFFPCGGIAMGISMSHKIGDACTILDFLKAWSDTAALGCNSTIVPNFTALSSRFPNSNDLAGTPIAVSNYQDGQKYVVKRFVFEASKIQTLKDRVRSIQVEQPTRVEAVSSLLWKSSMAAAFKSSGAAAPKSYAVFRAVNLRSKLNPPLPKFAVGNGVGTAMAMADYGTREIPELATLASRLRKVVVDTHAYNIYEAIEKLLKVGPMERLFISSLCGFQAYEVDFGWGKPAWFSPVLSEMCCCKVIILLDTSDGEGVDVEVCLPQVEMAILETDPEFLHFALPNPSPLTTVHKPSRGDDTVVPVARPIARPQRVMQRSLI